MLTRHGLDRIQVSDFDRQRNPLEWRLRSLNGEDGIVDLRRDALLQVPGAVGGYVVQVETQPQPARGPGDRLLVDVFEYQTQFERLLIRTNGCF